jgi:hypothetical protein
MESMWKTTRVRRPSGSRFLAGVLLTGFLLWNVGPVCGNPTDVDVAVCCKRHGCHVVGSHRGERSMRSDADKGVSPEGGAQDCCRRARVAHPVARAQTSVLCANLRITLRVSTPRAIFTVATAPKTLARVAPGSAPLKIPLVALYKLDSAYRI